MTIGPSLMEFLAVEFEKRNRQLLTDTLKRVSPKNLKGTWLNMASGNGIYMEEIAKAAGVERLIHFDNHRPFKSDYRKWLVGQGKTPKKAKELSDRNFQVASISDLIVTSGPEKLKKPICKEPINGIVMVNPWQDIPGLIWPTFEVGKIVLKPGQQMVIIADRSEWPYLEDAAKRFWFRYEKQGSAGVFTQTGEYIR